MTRPDEIGMQALVAALAELRRIRETPRTAEIDALIDRMAEQGADCDRFSDYKDMTERLSSLVSQKEATL